MRILSAIAYFFLLIGNPSVAQESAITWQVSSKRLSDKSYELTFRASNPQQWEIYHPSSDFDGITAGSLQLPDSTIRIVSGLYTDDQGTSISSQLFTGKQYTVFTNDLTLSTQIEFQGTVPGTMEIGLVYTFGKNEAFFPGETAQLSVELEGGSSSSTQIKIEGLTSSPVNSCGGEVSAEEKSSMLTIFLLGLLGGLFALLTPCVFPMVPLTVSYFTKHSNDKKSGRRLAILYGLFIFLIYVSFSIPFHLAGNVDPTIYNEISTNVYLNVAFFLIFLFFAISFFGYYEITLPGGLANSTNARQGSGIIGVFFMALTLAIVSFSCTGPILGTLLVGTATEGAWPLTAGLAGFGVALGLPFGLFALFPQWLNSLPKSGSWLNTVKVVLGFIELALALKFLSNADLVSHWSIIKREIFFGVWVLIFLGLFIYLMGWIRFPHDNPNEKIGKPRKLLALVVLLFTLYISPGVTNSRMANISLVSGFPPPLCYSIYSNPVNCEEPLKDYAAAVEKARKENKPILIDFTGWACVNCRKMEENVWTKPEVQKLMADYILVSLYVDDKKVLPVEQQFSYATEAGAKVLVKTVGDKWSLFQTENFNATSQPWYVALSPDEQLLTDPVGYVPDSKAYAAWLQCGLDAFNSVKK
ncbi:MAG: protein-disulfide reductase DsbD family protein [Chitinophagaceae bacterium]|jgi:thiol:disulfide interchange protein